MAQSKLSSADHDKSLECSICFTDFVQPKQLPCFHTFCLKCLTELCREKTDKSECPLCRREFNIPKDGIEKLPNNEFMMRLVLMKDVDKKEEKRNCEVCAAIDVDFEAKAFCIECQQCLCLLCQKRHSAQTSSKTHNVVNINEKPSPEKLNKMKVNYCLKHSEEEARIYCCDCSEVLCTVCHVQDHGKHNCQLIDKVVQTKKDVFSKYNNRLKNFLDEGSKKLEHLQQERGKTLSEAVLASQSIEETFNKAMDLILSYKTKLINIVETARAKRLKEIDNQEDLDQFCNTELNSFLSYSSMVMERGTDCEILRVADGLNKRAQELIKSQEERNKKAFPACSIKYISPNTPPEDNLENFVGTVVDADKTKRFLNSDLVTMVKSIQLSHKDDPRDYGANSINGITVLDDQMFVVQREESQIHVYDTLTFTVQPHINIPEMKRPLGLAGCSHNKVLYISDEMLHSIIRVQLSDKSIKFLKLKDNCYPRGLSVTSEQNILVTVRKMIGKKSTYSILEHRSDGQMIRDIQLAIGSSIEEAWQTIQLSNDTFIVSLFYHGNSLSCLHRLRIIDCEGQIIKSHDREMGRRAGQLGQPCSIVLDKNSEVVFAADLHNERVLMLCKDVTFLGHAQIKEELSSPSCLYFDSTRNRLIIGEKSGRVLVFGLKEL